MPASVRRCYRSLPEIEKRTREMMRDAVAKNAKTPLQDIIREVTNVVDGFSPEAKSEFFAVLDKVPLAYPEDQRDLRDAGKEDSRRGRRLLHLRLRPVQRLRGVRHRVRRAPGAADGAGDRRGQRGARNRHGVPGPAARHVAEVPGPLQRHAAAGFEDRHAAQHADGAPQLRRARVGRRRVRGLRREEHPQGDHRRSPKPTCGRSSTRRPIASAPRPTSSTARAWRGWRRSRSGAPRSTTCSARPSRTCSWAWAAKTTRTRRRASPAHGPISDKDIVGAMTAVMRQEAFNHKNLQAIDGRLANGMSVMAMAAHTGCNTVYGSTPSNNPHPYPWMNSLFQDGVTVGWLLGESFIVDHGRRSVIPERLADALDASGRERDQRARVLRVRALQRRGDDRSGDPRAAEGMGGRRRRRHGRHRLSEHVEGHPPESAERQGAHAGHAGVLEHRRPEFGLDADAGRQRHERVRDRDPGQEHREEDRGRDLPGRPRLAVHRPGVDRQRAEAVQGDSRRPRIPRARRSSSASRPASRNTAWPTTWR